MSALEKPTGKPYWSAHQIADLLGVNPRTVYRCIRSGDIPAIRIGRALRIEAEAFEDYLAANRTEG